MLKKVVQGCLRPFGIRLQKIRNTPTPLHVEPNRDKLWIRDFGIKTVIDIGANTGQFASEIRTVLPNAMIYSFEPLVECFDELKRNMGSSDNFAAFNFALGDEGGETAFEHNEFSPSSSILPMAEVHRAAFPYTRISHTIPVQMRRLDDLASELVIERALLVKIDVQGYEDHVLRGGERVIRNASMIFIETSFEVLYEGQQLFDEIYQMLSSWGFNYKGALHQLNAPQNGRPLQEDSIFLNASASVQIP